MNSLKYVISMALAYQGQDCSAGADLCEIDEDGMICITWDDSYYGEFQTCEDCAIGGERLLYDSENKEVEYVCPGDEDELDGGLSSGEGASRLAMAATSAIALLMLN